MTSVITGRGDRGLSDTRDHQRIPKFDPRMEAVGSVDELSCFVGSLRVLLQDRPETAAQVLELQRDLYRLNAELATVDPSRLGNLRLLGPGDVKKLERWITTLESTVEPPAAFVLPGGGDPASAAADVCRAVCRRAERSMTLFFARSGSADGDTSALVYLNRCSDYFFLLALSLATTRDYAARNDL
ncbi:cob(I)yrinic acid a,c-diamide adenosyltransferase [Myxococcota bacterium]|jgi:cob(I)alamin adenosyltransferase|nr:cob(I)yrinic acid a,c-diamide adenosyltransferase [Myxococcota bacterium]MBU1411039.1 cob(I)yrinic acid a,c-diamide adenosyltransferase [Myxococcota bacterium]MBU1512322.1 cob(I)yrinic acid a,c-diamide adenosyltransferase [Myxococcota bacterium]PKN25344.1 MAG: ATP:cob(I)alamin adenosyltransferase [Deltaproteobacteria bacterium HGW-Deltaproteobacteria-22]